ncbi:MAG: response regulator [Candidatus Omnitrophota bacterium]
MLETEILPSYLKLVEEYEKVIKGEMISSPDSAVDEITDMKSRLLSSLSHEFCTPLSLVVAPLEQMLSECSDDKLKKKLSLIFRNAQRLTFLTNQVVELSRLEDKNLKLKASPHDLIGFLKGILASFQLLAEQNEINLYLSSDIQEVILYFETDKLAQIMCNLIMNALKFTPSGGEIRVFAGETFGDRIKISVYNSGPVIPQDQLPLLFDRFYQLNKGTYEHYRKGFGIGLALAKEYIQLHRGTIEVNCGEGMGTEFVIHLKKGKDHLKPEEIDDYPPFSVTEENIHIAKHYAFILGLEREDSQQRSKRSVEVESEQSKRETVLVVEDNLDMRRFLANLLDRYYNIVEAENGKEGIDLARAAMPDMIISDVVMPEMDGFQLCKRLKRDIKTSHIPIILLTAKVLEDDNIRGYGVGADDYICKPFNINLFLARIRNLMIQRQKMQQMVQRQVDIHPEKLSFSDIDNVLLKKIREFIEKNLSDPDFGLDQLSEALDISRSTLNRKIMALAGQTPQKFIQSYRLNRAVEFLKANSGNITEVAYKVGFSSSAYFTKCFKETFDRLPSDYKI